MPTMPTFLYLNPIEWIILAVLVIEARKTIGSLFHRMMAGGNGKHELHSEVHGILMAVTAQASAMVQVRDALAQIVSHAENPFDQAEKAEFHAAMLKLAQDQLTATAKLDDRLFEFVNSTKRIMRAMEGGVGSEDDEIIEQAKDIRMRSADKGIELTLEQAIKRAREQANFR